MRHFYFTGKTLLSDVPWIVTPECYMRVASATKSLGQCCRIFIEIPGYKCNRLQLLSQNSFEDDDLPVQVKKRMCSHGFRQELRTFQTISAFQHVFGHLETRVEERTFELSNYGFLRQ